MKKKTICLNMIVKNESHIILETLENIYKYIDYWVICDTGSDDNTKEIIENFFKEKNIKGELYISEWKNFAYNRTEAFKKAYKKTDYIWVIDADDIIVGEFKYPDSMNLDAYELKYGNNNFEYIRMQIFNNKLEWIYRGVLHEYPQCISKENPSRAKIKGNYYIDSRRLGDRNKDPEKYLKDASILIKAIEEKQDPELEGRYYFYAAQSYKDYGDMEKTIKYYKKRIEYGGWIEELYISYLEIGLAMIKLNENKNLIVETFLNGFRIIPDRTESLYYLCNYYYKLNDLINAYKIGKILLNIKPKEYLLFVRESISKWQRYKLMYEILTDIIDNNIEIKNKSIDNLKEDKNDLLKNILENTDFPEEEKQKLTLPKITYLEDYNFFPNIDIFGNDIIYIPDKSIEELSDICDLYDNAIGFNTYGYIKNNEEHKNLIILPDKYYKHDGLFIKKKININIIKQDTKIDYDKYNYYNKDLINKIIEKINKNSNKINISLSITTCKRYNLFEKTINSFINSCNDILLIDEYIGIDDNSNEEDRQKMKELYPFINWIFKDDKLKGHVNSMNLIINLIKGDYLIHLEDDWLFYEKMNYITSGLEILNQTKIINIDNIPEYYNLNEKKIKQVLFNKNFAETNEHNIVGGFLCKTENDIDYILHEHYPDKSHEYNLAITKYNNIANCIYWPHFSFRPSLIKTDIFKDIGKFNRKSHFFEKEYAERYYKKNYISCFFNKLTCRHIGKLTSEKGYNAYTLNSVKQFDIENIDKYIIKCVNLEKRIDRKEYIIKLFNENLIIDYEFYKAIDGLKLEPTKEIYNLFKKNDFGFRKSFIGCALSHYNLWKELLLSEYDYYIIFEDDIKVSKKFRLKLHNVIDKINIDINKYDYILLGYSIFRNIRELHKNTYDDIDIDNINITELNKNLYIGGTFGYIITKSGADIIIDYINKNSIKHGIDYLIKIIPDIKIYECQPHIVFSDMVENYDLNVDSDIQMNYDSFDFSNIELNSYEWIFYEKVDYGGHDILYLENKSYNDLIEHANKLDNCVAFNTLGFFKDSINIYNLHQSIYFSEKDGIYIRKDIINKYFNYDTKFIRVKMICNWVDSKTLCDEWNNMTQGNYKWNNIELTWEDYNIDYYIIINKSTRDEYFIPEKTIIFHMEPWCNNENQTWGVKTWGEWARPDPNKFLQVRDHKHYHNNVFWQLKQTWTEFKQNKIIKDISKGNRISTICSSKYFDPGHIKRIDFIKFIESKNDPDVIIDIYNYDNLHNFKNYIGPHPENNKDIGITPYKYYFMSENNIEYNFMTEKIWEPLLTESLCFYWGCPNLSDYINPLAYIELDLNDFEKSFNIIKNAVINNLWEERLDIIKKEKNKVLDYYGFCPTIERIINEDINDILNLYNKYLKPIINIDKLKNICFIHSCTINNNTEILNYLIDKIINYNLIDNLDLIIINNIGNTIENVYNNNKIYIINYSDDNLLFEIPTINLIYTFSYIYKNVNLLYLHTKGISYNNLYDNIKDWINMMLYYLVEEYNNCFELLKKYNIIGCNYKDEPKPHFSGNFWWSNTNYIKRLYKIKSYNKHDAEWWICSNKMNLKYCIHNSNINHYETIYSKDKYNKLIKFYSNITNININPLLYIFEEIKLKHKDNTLWIIINSFNEDNTFYISRYSEYDIYMINLTDNYSSKININNNFFTLNKNSTIKLINKESTDLIDNIKLLDDFLQNHNKKISFINIDTKKYDITYQILNLIKSYIDENCIILINNIVNYINFDNKDNNFKALYDFIFTNNIKYEYIIKSNEHNSLVIKINSIG